MKKILSILLAVSAVLCIASCSKDKEVEEAVKTLSVVSTDVVFQPAGGQGSIVVEAQNSFTAASDKSWCTVSTSGQNVVVNVSEWEGLESRYAVVTLTSGSEKVNVTVQQFGAVLAGFTGRDLVLFAEGATEVFPFESNTTVTAASEQDWITPTVGDGNMTVVVAENTTGKTRFGEVTISAGEGSHTFQVKQYPAFILEPTWTPSYGGRYNYRGTLYEVIQNEVEEGSEAGWYLPGMISDAEFKASGAKSLEEYAKIASLAAESQMAEMVAYYASYGYNYGPTDFMYNESDWDIFDLSDPGNYYAMAVGLDEDGYPTGRVAIEPFKIADYSNAAGWSAEYSGNYTYGGKVYDVVSYTAGEADSWVGLVLSDSEYEQNFFSDFGNLVMAYAPFVAANKPQLNTGAAPVLYNKFENGNYHIFMIGFDENYELTDKYYTTTFRIDEQPTEAYLAWLGDWTIKTPRTDGEEQVYDTWTIEKGLVNTNYYVNNFGGHPTDYGFTVTLDFNAEDGSITIANGQVVGEKFTDSQNREITPTLLAKAVNPTTGGVSRISGTFTIATGTLSEDGNTITLTPGTVTISSWDPKTNPISGMQVYGVHSNGAVYWQTQTPLPNTLERATSGSSVKKASVKSRDAVSVSSEGTVESLPVYVSDTPNRIAKDVEIPAFGLKDEIFVSKRVR